MVPLSASRLLSLWEDGHGRLRLGKGALLLQAACPEEAPDELARKSVGHGDALLLRLRALIFGPRIACLASCPRCATRLEFNVDTDELLLHEMGPSVRELEIQVAGYRVAFRLATVADLAAVDPDAAREVLARRLLLRCILSALKDDLDCPPDELPAEVLEAIADAMAAADPQADLRFAATCPSCGHEWSAVFDVVEFLWQEIDSWARRTLEDVHRLASAYGWSEDEILGLSPRRRRSYLELIAG